MVVEPVVAEHGHRAGDGRIALEDEGSVSRWRWSRVDRGQQRLEPHEEQVGVAANVARDRSKRTNRRECRAFRRQMRARQHGAFHRIELRPPLDDRRRAQQDRALHGAPERRHVRRLQVCEKEPARRADECRPLQLGGVDVRRGVEVCVDVPIRPVVQVDRRDAERALGVDLVVAAERELGEVGEQRLLAPLGGDERIPPPFARRERIRLRVQVGAERVAHVVDECRQADRSARDVEDRLCHGAATDHVHMDHGAELRTHLRSRVKERHRPLDLRRPHEAQCARRSGKPSVGYEARHRPRDLEDRHAAAGVVVRARPLVIEVATEDDLLAPQRGIVPGDRRRDDAEHPRMPRRPHHGVERDPFPVRQSLLIRAPLLERDHDAERPPGRERVEVPPPDHVVIVLPPRGHLVHRVAHHAGRAVLVDRERSRAGRLRRNEHQLATHIFASVVAVGRAGADVDEFRCDIAAVAVLSQHDRRVLVARHAHDRRCYPTGDAYLPQLGELPLPRRPRLLRAVHRVAVGGNLEHRRVGEPVAAQFRGNEVGGDAKRP